MTFVYLYTSLPPELDSIHVDRRGPEHPERLTRTQDNQERQRREREAREKRARRED